MFLFWSRLNQLLDGKVEQTLFVGNISNGVQIKAVVTGWRYGLMGARFDHSILNLIDVSRTSTLFPKDKIL